MYFNKNYVNYLRSPKWTKKRQEAFAKYGKRCAACGWPGNQVHHLSYQNLGHEPLSDLMILCAKCHKEITARYRKNRRRGLRQVSWEYVIWKRNNGSSAR